MARTLGLLAGCLVLVLLRGADGNRKGKVWVYCVAIKEEMWDYAPSGKNLINGKTIAEDEHAKVYLENGPHRIGRVYKKAMYREYTDCSYRTQAARPEWLGFLGPILRAEVHDTIIIHMKNFGSQNYSMHPHGVFYRKTAEGALYPDRTQESSKMDDHVPPGGSYTYRWEVKPEHGPTDDDPDCITWIYHSHVNTARDTYSGLVGPLITCKEGTLRKSNKNNPEESVRYDVDQYFYLLFTVVDENQSWYIDDNVKLCTDPGGVDVNDPGFRESNMMHSINGYMYGNLPGLKICQHRAVACHMAGLGNEVDIHSISYQGNTLMDRGHRCDTVSLFPATFITAKMIPRGKGKWLLSCQVNDHFLAGMQALYHVVSCGTKPSSTSKFGIERHYYLAAETILWNYAPTGKNLISNTSLTEPGSTSELYFGRSNGRIGARYYKTKFVQYTDATFTTKKPTTHYDRHLGLMGPVLRCEVGDFLLVTLWNKADHNVSMHPHGLHYKKHFQGTDYEDGTNHPGAHVHPGSEFTYKWRVLEGPSSSDPDCIPYMYYSASDPVMDTSSGLCGPMLVCKPNVLGKNGHQKRVDKEFFLLFSIIDENLSWYLNKNIERFGSSETNKQDPDFLESNRKHAVNGRLYGNLFGLGMCSGDNVVWYAFGMGSETDMHGIFFEENTVKMFNNTRDTVTLFPHMSSTFVMHPNNPGVYGVECRTTDHYEAGMRQLYRVRFCPGKSKKQKHKEPTKVVQYFISAEEQEWDYSPSRKWELEFFQTSEANSPGNTFVGKGPDRIGSRYKKAVYREYTDETFSVRKNRQPHEQHLGILGPRIYAMVGELVVITFKNKASRPYSLNLNGLKASGSHVAVQPGNILELTWDIPESSGPGPDDLNCIVSFYHSTVNYPKDLYSGLIGPLIICRCGTLSENQGSNRYRKDVDKDFALLFMIFDENQSWYLDDNIRTYLGVDPTTFDKGPGFHESNMMHGINGRVYGNLRGLVMRRGQRVSWHLMAMGNFIDVHTAHYHAETFTYKIDTTHRGDVYDLFAGSTQEMEMVAGNAGTWLLHCHVDDHLFAGMDTTYTILEKSTTGAGSENKSSFKTLMFGLIAAKLHH
nr:ferroxidase HEPHL1 [Nothobranchius furzeri]